jgi:hypothetical protein
MTVNPRIKASHKRAIARRGVPVKFRRVVGSPPNAVPVEATVKAVIQRMTPDTRADARLGFADTQPGSFTQHMRNVLVMADDLTAQGFPLPVREGDDLFVINSETKLSVSQVDTETRAIAGAIEIIATGVK